MRALVYRSPDGLVLEERPIPSPGPGEAVVKVEACSICGTDLRIASGGHRAFSDGVVRVPGHEIAGVVSAVGAGVALSEGESVFVAPNYGCGNCRWCRRGDVNMCESQRALGITDDGAFAEYTLLPRELVSQGNVMATGGDLSPAVVALVEPLACVLRGARACSIQAGDVVVVFGAGPIGLLFVKLAQLAGAAHVVVANRGAERRQRALEWGASAAFDPDTESPAGVLESLGATRGADVVIVAAPAASAQQQALELAGPGGRINFFGGLPRGASSVELDTNLIHYKELVVTGTTANTNDDCSAALALVRDGEVDTASLIDARFELEEASEAFALASSGRALKVVIEP